MLPSIDMCVHRKIHIYYIRVWSCKYNPFHDQLLATGGSDSVVLLHSAASVSSAPHGDPGYTTSSSSGSGVESGDDSNNAENQSNSLNRPSKPSGAGKKEYVLSRPSRARGLKRHRLHLGAAAACRAHHGRVG